MLFVVNEHFFDGVEVAVAIHVVWLHVARFGPLVPTVDCDKRNLLGVAVNIFFCHTETFFKLLWCVVAHAHAFLHARTVVPADAHVRIVWNIELGVDFIPFFFGFFENVTILVVHPQVVAELIVGGACEAEFFDEIVFLFL